MCSYVSPTQKPEENNEGERSDERRRKKAIEDWSVVL
jgi:hypothetical protein